MQSESWFEFLSRRAEAIHHFLQYLKKHNPSNRGTLTSLGVYMLQSVYGTPIILQPFLRQALKDLGSDQIAVRYGIFFLHNFNRKSRSPLGHQIEEKDSVEVLKVMKATQVQKKQQVANAVTSASNLAEYPFGPYVTWPRINSTMSLRPWELMQDFVWDPELEHLSETSKLLFIAFTNSIWAGIAAAHITDLPPVATNLQEALSSWAFKSVADLLRSGSFRASNAELQGNIQGRRHQSFAQLRPMFFPLPLPDLSTEHLPRLQPLYEPDIGYLHLYEKELSQMPPQAQSAILEELDQLFRAMQCLPDARPFIDNQQGGSIWRRKHNSILVLTNSRAYKLLGIASGQRGLGRAQGPAAMAKVGDWSRRLYENAGETPLWAQLSSKQLLLAKKAQKDRRSAKSKRKRAPPKRTKVGLAHMH
jgi:hypothetical protein